MGNIFRIRAAGSRCWVTWNVRFVTRPSALSEIVHLREEYRAEMNCQIVYDSIHERPGWTQEYALEFAGRLIGYGSIAVGGPWREAPNLFEFYVQPQHRNRIFEAFESFVMTAQAKAVETQTNDRLLSMMVHTYASEIETGAIVFEDRFTTSHAPANATVRKTISEDLEALERFGLDSGAEWVLTVEQTVAGAGGVLYHYNRPYGDIYMKTAEPFRRRGLGSYLV